MKDDLDLKSLFSSIGFILLYIYSTIGIIKLFSYTDDEYRFEGKVKFLVLLSFLFSFFYIISVYHIVGPSRVEPFYYGFIIGHLIYIIVGAISNMLITK